MKKLFTALVTLVLSLSVSAQFYIYCSNGDVLEVDSISLVKPDNSNNHEDNSNNHEYVDLGLPSGLKWATCNVGATTPEDYGDYFAWGEVEPKTTYYWDTYKYYDGSNFTKYTGSDKTVLDPEDDAATANWGGSWRMPTTAEQQELINNCTWDWTTQNGVNGYKVTGPNGNSIFLPAAGFMDLGTLDYAGSRGRYWSSSLDTDSPNIAYSVNFNSGSVDWSYSGRYYGLTVRPVCPPKEEGNMKRVAAAFYYGEGLFEGMNYFSLRFTTETLDLNADPIVGSGEVVVLDVFSEHSADLLFPNEGEYTIVYIDKIENGYALSGANYEGSNLGSYIMFAEDGKSVGVDYITSGTIKITGTPSKAVVIADVKLEISGESRSYKYVGPLAIKDVSQQ